MKQPRTGRQGHLNADQPPPHFVDTACTPGSDPTASPQLPVLSEAVRPGRHLRSGSSAVGVLSRKTWCGLQKGSRISHRCCVARLCPGPLPYTGSSSQSQCQHSSWLRLTGVWAGNPGASTVQSLLGQWPTEHLTCQESTAVWEHTAMPHDKNTSCSWE